MFDALFSLLWPLIYNIASFLCWIMQCIYETFELFAGIRSVEYQGDQTSLINVFFNNKAISTLYGGMATIGIVLCFAFCMVAVIRKMFDIEEKMQGTLGSIVGNMLKSILLILMMNFIMVVVLNSTNLLLKQVDYVFSVGSDKIYESKKEISFTDEDYATMARIYTTIGNHAVNSSYDSRMNVNDCFNKIRKDMLLLEKKDVFEFDYNITETGEVLENWQSVLVPIAKARSLDSDIAIDEYNDKLVDAMVYAMEVLKSGRSFTPLSHYVNPYVTTDIGLNTRLDALVMLTGTMSAAGNVKYNENPSIFDSLRGPYMRSERDMYDMNHVTEDFEFAEMDLLLMILSACFLGYQFIFIAINAVARIFNMILLYLAAPPIIASAPLDGGGKMKQWTISFIIQSLSIVGALMSMRLVTFFVPIIYDESLILFPGETNGARVYLIRLFFVLAVAFTANKSIGMLSGILSDSAGMASSRASNIGDSVVDEIKSGYGNIKSVVDTVTGKKDKDKEGDKKKEDSGNKPENKAGTGEKDSGKSNGSTSGPKNNGTPKPTNNGTPKPTNNGTPPPQSNNTSGPPNGSTTPPPNNNNTPPPGGSTPPPTNNGTPTPPDGSKTPPPSGSTPPPTNNGTPTPPGGSTNDSNLDMNLNVQNNTVDTGSTEKTPPPIYNYSNK